MKLLSALGTTGASVSVSDSQQLSHEQMDREAQIQVDYRTLPINLREVYNNEVFALLYCCFVSS